MSKTKVEWEPNAVGVISGIIVWLVLVFLGAYILGIGLALMFFAAPVAAGHFAGRSGRIYPVAIVSPITSYLVGLIGVSQSHAYQGWTDRDTHLTIVWACLNGILVLIAGYLTYRSRSRRKDSTSTVSEQTAKTES